MLVLILITDILTAILGWGSFLCSFLLAVLLFLKKKHRIIAIVLALYAVVFLVLRFCFPEFFFRWVPMVAIFETLLSVIWANYEDRKNGKRWWNW